MLSSFLELWSVKGRLGRRAYTIRVAALLAIVYNTLRFTVSTPSRWQAPFLLFPNAKPLGSGLDGMGRFLVVLEVAVAVGLMAVWSVRRLRDAALPLWLSALLAVPAVNVAALLAMGVAPSESAPPFLAPAGRRLRWRDRIIPESQFGSACIAVFVSAIVATGLIWLGVGRWQDYSWLVFVVIPFSQGFVSALAYGYHEPRTLAACNKAACLSVTLTGLLVMALAVEGFICVLMAAPLAYVAALGGAGIGHLVQANVPRRTHFPTMCLAILVMLPPAMRVEKAVAPKPEELYAQTSVVINAPPEAVWPRVVRFPTLPPPDFWLFRLGVAYPISATLGRGGVGAVRHCRFSTGDMEEPITIWQPPNVVRFHVATMPLPMRELSPYPNLHPAHLDGFVRAWQGQITLTRLPGNRTQADGATWYENRLWPAPYWRLWSDLIIHHIHSRLLDQVKQTVEAARRTN